MPAITWRQRGAVFRDSMPDLLAWRNATAPARRNSEGSRMASMSANKQTVRNYMTAFARTDRAAVLACLADDVEWSMPGMFHVRGKDAFNGAIVHDEFEEKPEITVDRLVEEDDVVVAEGRVRSARKDGTVLNAVFCDVFSMRDGKIRQLTSYLKPLEPA